jgi:hypothetical protein
MKFLSLALAASLALAPALMKADDAFAGWTEAQLKTKILQLQKENATLKAASAGSAQATAQASAKATADMLLDDFEGATAKNGNAWWAGCDDNKLGTTLLPQPWAPEKGGAKGSGHSGRIHGNFGSSKAPWPWATLSLAMSNPDISGYSALSFYAKGDGSTIRVQIGKLAVKDFATHETTFKAGSEWTLVTLPLSSFKQPSWGKAVGDTFNDVEKLAFGPMDGDKAYDFSIDDVTLVK